MVKEAGPQMDKQAKEMGKSPKDILGFMAMMTPSDITITSVKVEGKKATLTATRQARRRGQQGHDRDGRGRRPVEGGPPELVQRQVEFGALTPVSAKNLYPR